MPLRKSLIITIVLAMLLVVNLSGCIFEDIIAGTSFTLKSYEVDDYEGFPVLDLKFTFSDKVKLEMYDPYSNLLDTDFFYKSSNDEVSTELNIGDYRKTVNSGTYNLKILNKKDEMISEEKFTFSQPKISIDSCFQYWWKETDSYRLIGLKINLQNTGDTPAYPYSANLEFQTKTINCLLLPKSITPDEEDYVQCYFYDVDLPTTGTFNISIKDADNSILATNTYELDIQSNIFTKTYTSQLENQIKLPYYDYLYNYYCEIPRITIDDYGLFVFDVYDDVFLEILLKKIRGSCDFGEFEFNLKSDEDKINYITGFVQGLEYKKDSLVNESFEYPRYPVETVFNAEGGGDCEDKAILTASLLELQGYDVALLRLPNHMAVGVNLSSQAINRYDHYIDNYYFLETTTPDHRCGYIPDQHKSRDELTVYPIQARPLLYHEWKDGLITQYSNTEKGDFVKIIAYIQNLGDRKAENITFEGVFCTDQDYDINYKTIDIDVLEPGDIKKVVLDVEIPTNFNVKLKTRIYYENEIVDTEESSNYF